MMEITKNGTGIHYRRKERCVWDALGQIWYKNPYFIFAWMKEKEGLGYILGQCCFGTQLAPLEADDVFMNIEKLCAVAVLQHTKALIG